RRGVALAKTTVIAALGPAVARRAHAAGVPVNAGFSGVYAFAAEKHPTDELFQRFISGLPSNGVVMCHPGYVDSVLTSLDSMTDARESELHFLMSDGWTTLLTRQGVELGPLLRIA